MNFTFVFKYINGAINRPSPAPSFPFGREPARTGLNYRFNRITSSNVLAAFSRGKGMCFLPCKNGNEKEMLLEILLANETEKKSLTRSSLAL